MEPFTTAPDPCPLPAPSALPALPVSPRAAPATLLLGPVPGVLGLHDRQGGHSPGLASYSSRLLNQACSFPPPVSPGTLPQGATWGRPLMSSPEPDTLQVSVRGTPGVPRTKPRTWGLSTATTASRPSQYLPSSDLTAQPVT